MRDHLTATTPPIHRVGGDPQARRDRRIRSRGWIIPRQYLGDGQDRILPLRHDGRGVGSLSRDRGDPSMR